MGVGPPTPIHSTFQAQLIFIHLIAILEIMEITIQSAPSHYSLWPAALLPTPLRSVRTTLHGHIEPSS